MGKGIHSLIGALQDNLLGSYSASVDDWLKFLNVDGVLRHRLLVCDLELSWKL